MSIVEQAMTEMERAGFPDDEREAIREILSKFFDTWDSGGAVSVMVPVLAKLVEGRPLSPLTGEESEWFDHGIAGPYRRMRQNLRCSSVFENTDGEGRITYRDVDNRSWDGSFPYTPGLRNLDPVLVMEG